MLSVGGYSETTIQPAADRQGYLASVCRFADRIPLRRIGQPEDVAAAVAFLAGKQQLQAIEPVPEQTIETLKEDKQWLSEQRN